MKALEKDRNRRYETANGFAADLQRYLADEPVQACPPSSWYRFRKFVRRNKQAVFAALLIFLTLLGGVIGTTWGLIREQQHSQELQAAHQRERACSTSAPARPSRRSCPKRLSNNSRASRSCDRNKRTFSTKCSNTMPSRRRRWPPPRKNARGSSRPTIAWVA